jgi:hypothetical protein
VASPGKKKTLSTSFSDSIKAVRCDKSRSVRREREGGRSLRERKQQERNEGVRNLEGWGENRAAIR